MENFMLSANAVLPMFLLLAAGYLSKRFGILSLEDIPRTNRIAFRIFLPCLLFYNIYNLFQSMGQSTVVAGLTALGVPGAMLILSLILGTRLSFTGSVLDLFLMLAPAAAGAGLLLRAFLKKEG